MHVAVAAIRPTLVAARSLPLAASLPPAAVLAGVSLAACRAEAASGVLSPPLLAFVIAAVLSNVGILPASAPAYDACAAFVLPLAVATGLLAPPPPLASGGQSRDSQLLPMLCAFGVGALGSALGAWIMHAVTARWLRLWTVREAAAAAGCLSATYIGGSANFFGVAAAVGASELGALLPSLLAADLVVMGVYLVALTGGSRLPLLQRVFSAPARVEAKGADAAPAAAAGSSPPPPLASARARLASAAWLGGGLLLAAACCACGRAVEVRTAAAGSGMLCTSLLCSALCGLVGRAPAAAAALRRLAPLSSLLACGFLASLGGAAQLAPLLSSGRVAALACVLAVHAVAMLGGCALLGAVGLRVPLPVLLLASNANVGGAGTAVAMASAMGWHSLVPAAAACGTCGYAVATLAGVALHGRLVTL